MGGSKKSEQLQRLAEEPGRLVGSSRFLGRVEVPLSETLSLKRGVLPLLLNRGLAICNWGDTAA